MADIFKQKTHDSFWHYISYSHSDIKHPYHKDSKKIHRKARKALKRDLNRELEEDCIRA